MDEIIAYDSLSEKDKAINDFVGVTPEKTGFHIPPNGCVAKCTMFPCDKCSYYYGEIHECMRDEIAE